MSTYADTAVLAEETQYIASTPELGLIQRLRLIGGHALLGLLLVATLSSALAVVYAKHLSRGLFAELQALEGARHELEVEWGRLLLEQTTWASHSRIEQIARTKLDMVTPQADTVMMVRP
jgi:cell division protein FtsL